MKVQAMFNISNRDVQGELPGFESVEMAIGTLSANQRADFVLWDVHHPAELVYAFGSNPCLSTIWGGQIRQTISYPHSSQK